MTSGALEAPWERQNYLAITVAAIACFLLETLWYSFFLDTWLKGLGHSRAWLHSTGVSLTLQCITALLAEGLIAGGISRVTKMTGAMTAVRGMRVGAGVWAGFVVATWAAEYAFEVRPFSLLAVNLGFWLVAMVMMGAIVGGWKKKA